MKSLFEQFFLKDIKDETAKQITESLIKDSKDLTYIGQYAKKKSRELMRCKDTVCSREHNRDGDIDFVSYSSLILCLLDEYFKKLEDERKG
jgi:hypothetical protein